MSNTTMNTGRLVAGLALIVVGALFLLDQSGTVDAGKILSGWWPVIIIAIGLVQLMVNPQAYLGPAIIVVAGFLFLGSTLDLYSANVWDLIWPAVLVLVGLSILSGHSARERGVARTDTSDRVHSVAIFSGTDIASQAAHLTGADMTAIFGGATLDLRSSTLAPEGGAIDVTAIFGGAKIIVPTGWAVEVNGTPIFGGFNNKTTKDELPAGAPVLVVRGIAAFGGVDVQYEP